MSEHRPERVPFRDPGDARCVKCRQRWPCSAAPKVTAYFSVEAMGQHIGLCACLECGAVLLLGDDAFDSPAVHAAWHERIAEGGKG